jgi:hypothetical protein
MADYGQPSGLLDYSQPPPVMDYAQLSPLADYADAPLHDYSAPSVSRSVPPAIVSRSAAASPRRLWQRGSVRFAAGAVVVAAVLGLVFGLVMWVGAERPPAALAPASSVPTGARLAPPASEDEARRRIEGAIATAGLGELTAASQAAAAQLKSPAVVAAHAFAAALLASEYGIPVAAETRTLADAVLTDERLKSELAAARVLFALAAGNPGAAAHAAEGASDSPWLAFARAKAARLAGGGNPEEAGEAVGAALVLRAEAAIDQGDPLRAAQLMTGLLARAPTQVRARLALAEARAAQGVAPGADESRDLRNACASEGPRSVVIEAGCALVGAEELRRKSQRLEARALALKVATLAPPEPRMLGRAAQLLLNLGETRRAEALINKARIYAAASYPPVGWAVLGARINRGAQIDAGTLPPPATPDSRLLAVRAALAREGAAGVRKALMKMNAAQVAADPDVTWFAMLPRVQRPRTAVKVAERYAGDRRPPGPVGSYVLGLLARWGGKRPLAVRWLSQARAGHGDACSAVSLEGALVPRYGRRPPRLPSECDPRLAPDLAAR